METISLEVEGIRRRALIHVPGSDAARLPLLLAFHGGEGRPELMDRLTSFNALADEAGFCVAYPEGLNRHWSDGRVKKNETRHDDVKFISALIDFLMESEWNIDGDRIFAAGISNGGFFAQYLFIQGETRIKAVASVAATLPQPVFEYLSPPGPISVLFILGTCDPVVPYEGGEVGLGRRKRGEAVSADLAVQYWRRANRLAGEAEIAALPRTAENDVTCAVVSTWRDTAGGVRVALVRVEGGGHTWPGGWQFYREKYIGVTSRQFEASKMIWDFFKCSTANVGRN